MESDDLTKQVPDGIPVEERAAFELFEPHRGRLRAGIVAGMGARLKQAVDPDDIVQETFLRAFQTLPHFRPNGSDSLFSWLAAIARHLVLNASRKKRPQPIVLDLPLPADIPSPSKVLRREERFDRLRAALAGLTDDQQEAVILARLEGLRTREVARRMARSEEAVRQLISRGLERLKRSMGTTDSFRLPDREIPRDGGRP